MLELLIVFGVFTLLMSLVSKPFEKKIKTAASVEEALAYRKKLKWLRMGVSIFFVVLYVGLSIYLNPDVNFWLNGKGKNFIAILFGYLVTEKGFKELSGNVSTFTKETFLNKFPEFALYLRGFEDDNYGVVKEAEETTKFSELNFMEQLEAYIPACAIGMTKEADAPFGAKRVYVSDESWKKDVRELMIRAKRIFVLLNDRPSCVWEIEQSADILNKTCFLVEDVGKYNSIREKLSGKIDFPALPDLGVEAPFALMLVDNPGGINKADGTGMTDGNQAKALHYKNSKEGYEELLSLLIRGVTAKTKSKEVGKKVDSLAWKALKIIGYLIAMVLLLEIDIRISDYLMDVLETGSDGIKWVTVALLFVLECFLYKIVAARIKLKRK